MKRISVVDYIKINALLFSSIFEIGDTTRIAPVSKALAVQREVPIFFTNEGDLSNYPIFTKELPTVPINERISMESYHQNPVIKVNSIRILGVSSSSVVQIGSTEIIESQSRVKHIRQLLKDKSDSGK
ncbi:spore germination protein GerPE [Fredinandcohnia sp. 179-A 10B2 NHS]|uniref:spore germination protein GerPE n=1 Tax=Fredinandcohnia sp. 179-A 10B2 NHS TaxID=3235176 RepID=UPI0039A0F4C2